MWSTGDPWGTSLEDYLSDHGVQGDAGTGSMSGS